MFVKKHSKAGEGVKELMRGFEPANIWNQGETGTMWEALPEKGESAAEVGKMPSKESQEHFL